jgi:hypothetical protein
MKVPSLPRGKNWASNSILASKIVCLLCLPPRPRLRYPHPSASQLRDDNSSSSRSFNMPHVTVDDDNWEDDDDAVRDLVKPLKTPRLRELVLRPWLRSRRRALMDRDEQGDDELEDDEEDEDYRRTLGEHRFREFQLVGSGDAAGDDEGRAVPPWLLQGNGDDTAAVRFLSFLFRRRRHPHAVIVVVWLSPHHFVACDSGGELPLHRIRGASMVDWSRDVRELHAHVTTTDGKCYQLCFGVVDRANANAADDDDDAADVAWMPALGSLLAQRRDVASIVCDLDVNRHLSFLEAVVSPAPPPPPQQGRRTLTFALRNWPSNVSEAAARILACHTHPDTRVGIDLVKWSREGAIVLADAVRTNQCPKRLAVSGAAELEKVEPLADALRVTTSLEELDLALSSDADSEALWCSRLLLDAIGRNVGLRKFAANRFGRINDDNNDISDFMKELWSSVLRSRTLTSVNVQLVMTSHVSRSGAGRRAVAQHVVQLLQSNRVVTHLLYNPDSHDPYIMETQALPLLQLNRLRAAATDTNRYLGAFLGSDPVRRCPMLRYQLLRSSVSTLARHGEKLLLSAASRGADEDERDRKRARRDGPT